MLPLYKDYQRLVQKLLSGHKQTHTHSGPITLFGPLKWSVTITTLYEHNSSTG